ncbi:MAG: M23 family metallopeptidase, partial [Oscillospiraceae bacterium]|nr:M23 family metallopeptidase [Oscillospiraceae bacterium]
DAGEVELARYNYFTLGHTVIIRHSNGLRTLYAHASAIYVKEGQQVAQGELIAAVGSTGRSSGNHVHFEVIDGNRKMNPENYLPARNAS